MLNVQPIRAACGRQIEFKLLKDVFCLRCDSLRFGPEPPCKLFPGKFLFFSFGLSLMFTWLSVVSTHTSISLLNHPVAIEHRLNTVETGLRSLSETITNSHY